MYKSKAFQKLMDLAVGNPDLRVELYNWWKNNIREYHYSYSVTHEAIKNLKDKRDSYERWQKNSLGAKLGQSMIENKDIQLTDITIDNFKEEKYCTAFVIKGN